MRLPEATNTQRAERGAQAVAKYAEKAKKFAHVGPAAYVAAALYAAEVHAKAAGSTSPGQDMKNGLRDEAFSKLSDMVADVLHHMDGACQGHTLTSAAWHLFEMHTVGEDTELIVVSDATDTGDAIDLLANLCHAVHNLDGNPLDVLASGLREFEEEAEAERVIQVRKAREDRLNG
ncbi:hypothetical protein [Streptomyces sp. NPDC026673]|uniref:hypothetical protein n=1 Tax=Streptomyces sp. NPDC026673 TaxID=3155724 RepID=UPI003409130B